MQLQTTNYRVCSMSKDVMNVTSWPTASMFRNWVSVVLSRVQTLSGLYLVKPIDIDKSFKPSDELNSLTAKLVLAGDKLVAMYSISM